MLIKQIVNKKLHTFNIETLMGLMSVKTSAQISKETFLVIKLAKSTNAGRWAGFPVRHKILGR